MLPDRPSIRCAICLGFLLLAAGQVRVGVAQGDTTETGAALNATVGTVGLSLGDARRTTGIRLNYRDRRLEWVRGINATVWRPHDASRGTVSGLAVGLPVTGAYRLRGVGVGGGIGVRSTLHGVVASPLGARSGGDMVGVAVGGVGIGAGRRLEGLMFSGIGVGAGKSVGGVVVGGLVAGAGERAAGVLAGGLGVGAGGQATGLLVGGLGAGSGGDATGVILSGVGAGAAGEARGVMVGGLGVGAGKRATGLLIGGIGVGAGTTLNGIGLSFGGVGAGNQFNGVGIAGVGIGAGHSISGVTVTGVGAGSSNITGLTIAGAYTRVQGGVMKGLSISAINDIRGTQRGLTIGIYNGAQHLHGVQLGLINVARNNPVWATVLPVLNLSF